MGRTASLRDRSKRLFDREKIRRIKEEIEKAQDYVKSRAGCLDRADHRDAADRGDGRA